MSNSRPNISWFWFQFCCFEKSMKRLCPSELMRCILECPELYTCLSAITQCPMIPMLSSHQGYWPLLLKNVPPLLHNCPVTNKIMWLSIMCIPLHTMHVQAPWMLASRPERYLTQSVQLEQLHHFYLLLIIATPTLIIQFRINTTCLS